MFIEYDKEDRVKVISELDWLGDLYNVKFIDDYVYFLQNIGYVSQQITYVPSLNFSLQDALGLVYAISAALGKGPSGAASASVKALSAGIQNRFHVNYFDINIQRFDVVEFFNDGVQYVNEAGPQLSELGNISDIETSLIGKSITLALVTHSTV